MWPKVNDSAFRFDLSIIFSKLYTVPQKWWNNMFKNKIQFSAADGTRQVILRMASFYYILSSTMGLHNTAIRSFNGDTVFSVGGAEFGQTLKSREFWPLSTGHFTLSGKNLKLGVHHLWLSLIKKSTLARTSLKSKLY